VPSFSKSGVSMITYEDKKSPLSEAYRSIGTYLQFSSAVKPPRIILVTSAQKGEGKTVTATNTAIALAHSQGRGIIIDCDLRRPRIHKAFNIDNSNGLSAFLTGNIEFGNNLVQETQIPGLYAIPAGLVPPNPSELLSSNRMRDLIDGLNTQYSFVILDAPPVLGFSDSLILSTLADGVIVVIKAGSTPREAATRTKKLLLDINAKILGVVLNGVGESDMRYGSYYYYYSYYYDEDEKGGKGKTKKGKHA
ncbi:MAG: CpsD/CapB family tyrosine-protein kinase, partial [Nitrospirae bacterium]|nr:CpsD/CapB family tyrosine-protein kinase [Nitrospirota bacterium]